MGSRIPFTVTINVPIPDIAPPDLEYRIEHTDNYSLNGGELISEIIYITNIKKPSKDPHITIYVHLAYIILTVLIFLSLLPTSITRTSLINKY